jgi:hypothetical protein
MNKHLSIAMFLLGACLALGFVYGMGKLSNAVTQFKRSNAIRVKGYAERQITSDTAAWSCTVTVRERELQEGYSRLKRDIEACRKQTIALGLPESAMSVGPIQTEVIHKRTKGLIDAGAQETQEIDHYELKQSVEVASREVAKVDRLSKEITDLISTGVEVRSAPAEFTCSQLEKVKLEMIAEAARNGRDRAAALAERSNGTVGPLISADQGVFQIVPVNSTEVSSEGVYNTATIQKTIKAVVTMEFSVSK